MRKTLRGMIVIMFLNFRERMGTTYDFVRDHLNQKFNYQRKQLDTGPGFCKYNVGDLVYVRDSSKSKGLSPKLQPHWQGPGIILRTLSDLVFEIRLNQKGKAKIQYDDRLKPYASEETPKLDAYFADLIAQQYSRQRRHHG